MEELEIRKLESGYLLTFTASADNTYDVEEYGTDDLLDVLEETLRWLGYDADEVDDVLDILDEDVYVLIDKGLEQAERLAERLRKGHYHVEDERGRLECTQSDYDQWERERLDALKRGSGREHVKRDGRLVWVDGTAGYVYTAPDNVGNQDIPVRGQPGEHVTVSSGYVYTAPAEDADANALRRARLEAVADAARAVECGLKMNPIAHEYMSLPEDVDGLRGALRALDGKAGVRCTLCGERGGHQLWCPQPIPLEEVVLGRADALQAVVDAARGIVKDDGTRGLQTGTDAVRYKHMLAKALDALDEVRAVSTDLTNADALRRAVVEAARTVRNAAWYQHGGRMAQAVGIYDWNALEAALNALDEVQP